MLKKYNIKKKTETEKFIRHRKKETANSKIKTSQKNNPASQVATAT
jgi:hypothetical protein